MKKGSSEGMVGYEGWESEYTSRNKNNDFILFLGARRFSEGGVKMVSFRVVTYSISEDRLLGAKFVRTGKVGDSFAERDSRDFYSRLLRRYVPTYKTKWMKRLLGGPMVN